MELQQLNKKRDLEISKLETEWVEKSIDCNDFFLVQFQSSKAKSKEILQKSRLTCDGALPYHVALCKLKLQ